MVSVGVGVAERVGVDVVGCGVRELLRLGADVVRVGRGVMFFAVDGAGDGVVDGVRRGVYDGLIGRTGAADEASSLAVAIVTGVSWLVTLLLSD
ncbi:hypothetical protein EV651_104267 [Kribbella sp. VKM Ac-2571]|uniref:hypothetical protein n=1 Tax=Kribbella sp. VKM Ac-2571 TaxID=2512222 RepID=UPI0010E02FBF|nr:hypothetical protein [Kribbella sp. VKM Ac-2571]TDO66700.1 hypothetical protein EV651_104267 [Kribbella sp. VKM Ac-2571]